MHNFPIILMNYSNCNAVSYCRVPHKNILETYFPLVYFSYCLILKKILYFHVQKIYTAKLINSYKFLAIWHSDSRKTSYTTLGTEFQPLLHKVCITDFMLEKNVVWKDKIIWFHNQVTTEFKEWSPNITNAKGRRKTQSCMPKRYQAYNTFLHTFPHLILTINL